MNSSSASIPSALETAGSSRGRVAPTTPGRSLPDGYVEFYAQLLASLPNAQVAWTKSQAAREVLDDGKEIKPYKIAVNWKTKPDVNLPAEEGAIAGYLARRLQSKNLALIATPQTKLALFDLDGEQAKSHFKTFDMPKSLTVKTSRGWHLWFTVDFDCEAPKIEFADDGTTIKCTSGGYGILAGWHAEGEVFYRPLRGFEQITALPEEAYWKIREAAGAAKQRARSHIESGQRIPIGQRDSMLTAYAGHLHGIGMPQDVTLHTLEDLLRNHIDWSDKPGGAPNWVVEMAKLEANVERWYRDWHARDDLDVFLIEEIKPPTRQVVTRPPGLTEDKFADHFVRAHGQYFRYVVEYGKWMGYTEERGLWELPAGDMLAYEAMVRLKRDAFETYGAHLPADDEYAKALKKFSSERTYQGFCRAALNIARARAYTYADVLDQHPYLLALPNGTLDLQTCAIGPHSPANLLTVGAAVPFTPDATCPLWRKFIREVTCGDDELALYLQALSGLCLTGDIREQLFWIFWGEGLNGKSTFVRLLSRVLGPDLAVSVDFSTLAQQRYAQSGSAPSPDVARLRGARLASAIEADRKRVLNDARIKQVTGGDMITARLLNENPISFLPTFKLVLVVNQQPELTTIDKAIKRRVKMVPWLADFTDSRNSNLEEELWEECEGILSWMVEGLRHYNTYGLPPCASIDSETNKFLRTMNPLSEFADEMLEFGDGYTAASLGMVAAEWRREHSLDALSNNAISQALHALGLEKQKTETAVIWHGARLRGAEV